MIRNMDLIRTIVLAIRDHEGRPSASEVQSLIGNDDNGIYGYHIVLLTQSELMSGVETGPRKDRYALSNLTPYLGGTGLCRQHRQRPSLGECEKDAGGCGTGFSILRNLVASRSGKDHRTM